MFLGGWFLNLTACFEIVNSDCESRRPPLAAVVRFPHTPTAALYGARNRGSPGLNRATKHSVLCCDYNLLPTLGDIRLFVLIDLELE